MGKLKDLFGAYPMLREAHAELGDLLFERDHLAREVEELREYRQKYVDELNRGINHGRHMIGSMLELAMKPGVLDAVAKANANANESTN